MHRSYGLQGSLKRRYKHPSPTSINGYHAAKKLLSQWPAKRPTFAFAGESGYTLAFANRIAHSGLHAETGAFRTGPLSLPSERSARSQISPGRVSERRTLPLWDLGREVLSKNAESLRDSDALMRVAVPRRRGPAGPRDLFTFVEVAACTPCAQSFLCVRGMGGITTLGALCVLLKYRTAACQSGSFAVSLCLPFTFAKGPAGCCQYPH